MHLIGLPCGAILVPLGTPGQHRRIPVRVCNGLICMPCDPHKSCMEIIYYSENDKTISLFNLWSGRPKVWKASFPDRLSSACKSDPCCGWLGLGPRLVMHILKVSWASFLDQCDLCIIIMVTFHPLQHVLYYFFRSEMELVLWRSWTVLFAVVLKWKSQIIGQCGWWLLSVSVCLVSV